MFGNFIYRESYLIVIKNDTVLCLFDKPKRGENESKIKKEEEMSRSKHQRVIRLNYIMNK